MRRHGSLYFELATGECALYDYDADPADETNMLAAGWPEPPGIDAAARRLGESRDCAGAGCQ